MLLELTRTDVKAFVPLTRTEIPTFVTLERTEMTAFVALWSSNHCADDGGNRAIAAFAV